MRSMQPREPGSHGPAGPPPSQRAPLLSRRRLLTAGAGLGAVALGSGAWAHWVEPEGIVLRHVTIGVDGWRRDADGLRIGVLSDVHVDCRRAADRARRAVEVLMAARPDTVLLAGDYVTYKPWRWASVCAEALAGVARAPGGAFAVMGNHDWWAGDPDAMAAHLAARRIAVLRNSAAPVRGRPGVWIVGLEDMIGSRPRPERAMRRVPGGAARVLLVHEPDYADTAPEGFAFQVSGHSHGGQVRVPGFGPVHLPKYGRKYPLGWQRAPRHGVYTTAGVGVVGPRLRFGVPPEAVVLEVRRSD